MPIKGTDRLRSTRIDESDILEAARELQGWSVSNKIKYAILKKDGRNTIVPKDKA